VGGRCALVPLAIGATLGAIGCGSVSEVQAAPPQTIEIGTTELDGHQGIGFVLEIRRLQITRVGWRVHAAVTNATPVIWTVVRPHVLGGTKFGLFVADRPSKLTAAAMEAKNWTTPQLVAETFDSPLPRVFQPGMRWSGSFAGPGFVPADSFVVFAFGRFSTEADPPAGLPRGLVAVTARPLQVH
jgi:hypothetical protein